MRRVQSGQAGEQMVEPLAGPLGGAPFKYFGDWTDRIAKGELPHAKPPRPQGVERNIVVTTLGLGRREAIPARSDRLGPALSDRQCLRPALRLARIQHRHHSDPRSRRRTPSRPSRRRCATRTRRRRSGPDMPRQLKPMQPSPYWGDEKIWDTKANNHNAHVRPEGPGVVRGGGARPEQPGLLQEGLRPSFGEGCSRWTQSIRQLTMLDPEDDEVHLRRHLLSARTICSSATTPTTRCGPAAAARSSAGSTPRCSTRPATRRSRRAGRRSSSTPTATASATTTSSPTSRSIRPRTSASSAGLLCRDAEPGRRLVWGTVGVFGGPGAVVRIDPGRIRRRRRSPKSTTCRCPASASRGGDIDKQGRRLGVARQRPSRQLRPQQMQGSAQRTEGDRRSLPRGLVVPPVSGSGLPRHRREQRRVELLHLGRPAQHVRARRGRADVHRQPQRRPDRAARTAR